MLRNLKVLLGQAGSAASIQMDQTTCQRAVADGFHDEPAGNYGVQWSYPRWSYFDTLREYGEHYLLADRVDTEGWWTFLSGQRSFD